MTPDALAEQISLLRAERDRATEPVVREALEAKITSLNEERELLLKKVRPAPAPVESRVLKPSEEAEFRVEVGRLRLLLTREDWRGAEAEVAKMEQRFGLQAETLEVRGDLAVRRKKFEDAAALFEQALSLSPGNVGIERKRAEAVFALANLGSLEDQLRGGKVLDADPMARAGIATFLSLLFPGIGQIVLGHQVKGGIIFGLWALAIGYMGIQAKEVLGLFRIIGLARGGDDPGALFWTALVMAFSLMLIAVFDCAAQSKVMPKRTVVHPEPPVNLPFE